MEKSARKISVVDWWSIVGTYLHMHGFDVLSRTRLPNDDMVIFYLKRYDGLRCHLRLDELLIRQVQTNFSLVRPLLDNHIKDLKRLKGKENEELHEPFGDPAYGDICP